MRAADTNTSGPLAVRGKAVRASIIVVLFLVSVAVRAPNLNQSLGQMHEWLTSTVLRTLQIWEQEGAIAHRFCPIMTYPGQANRNIPNQAGYDDGTGRMYYVSYPPFVYMLPYVIFRLLGVRPDVFPLRIFGLAVHFLTCLFIYLTVASLTDDKYRDRVNRPAIVAYLVYLFAPATLWFHSSCYMSDMLVQPLWAIGIYFFVRIQQGRAGAADYAALAVSTCLMVYTEWIAVFFVAAVMLYAVLHRQQEGMKATMIIVAVSTALPLVAMVWQYSQVHSFGAYLDTILGTYAKRSGLGENAEAGLHPWNPATWRHVWRYYKVSYLPSLVILYTLTWLWFFLKKTPVAKATTHKRDATLLALYLSLLPVVMHHLVFANFTTIHTFSVLKTGIFFAFLTGLLYSKLDEVIRKESLPVGRLRKMDAVHTLIGLMLLISVAKYSEIAHQFRNVDRYRNAGTTIAQEANDDEVVFLETTQPIVLPQIVVYARRNIAVWHGLAEARELLAANRAAKGIVLVFDVPTEQVTDIRRFQARPRSDGYPR